MTRDSRNRSPEALVRARRLRCDPSVSEKVVWKLLRRQRTGFGFRRQVPVGPYVLDFYCPEASVCVEIDGEQHRATVERDASRDQFLLDRRILTIRIPTTEIFDENDVGLIGHIEKIIEACESRSGRLRFGPW